MKLITFAVPSYNSQDYMSHCIDTLLSGGEEVEIIIVNDGSKDNTKEIADEYVAKYPTIVKAIHKENGGHGSGVNAGLKNATGLYYKVVDSDDWLDEEALKTVLDTIREHVEKGEEADLYISNFIYDHKYDNTQYVSHYRKKMPAGEFFGWDKVKAFTKWEMLLMHSLLYKTEKLRESGIVLPEHTFYVDNLFAFQPLPHMKKLYYIDVDLYHYFIGRADQSVNIANITKRYKQQILVMKLMTEAYTYDEIKAMDKGLRKFMFHALSAIMMNTIFFASGGKDNIKERKADLKQLWKDLKARDKKLYNKLRWRSLPALNMWMPFRMCGFVSTISYKILCKIVKLG